MQSVSMKTGTTVTSEAESLLNDSQRIVIADCRCDTELRSARHNAVFATMVTLGQLTTCDLSIKADSIELTVGPPDSASFVGELLAAVRPYECPTCW